MTWWSEYRDAYFELSTIVTAHPWDTPKGGRVYMTGDLEFYEEEIDRQFEEMEEQLWAIRNNLA